MRVSSNIFEKTPAKVGFWSCLGVQPREFWCCLETLTLTNTICLIRRIAIASCFLQNNFMSIDVIDQTAICRADKSALVSLAFSPPMVWLRFPPSTNVAMVCIFGKPIGLIQWENSLQNCLIETINTLAFLYQTYIFA